MKVIAKNPLAGRDYITTKTMTAGIVLKGHEVKSIRNGAVSVKGAYVKIMNDEAWLINAHVTPYPPAQLENYDPTQTRKLLLKKREINELASIKQSGLVLYPLAVVIDGRFIKISVGLGRSKKKHDKREQIKQRDSDRAINRRLKQQ